MSSRSGVEARRWGDAIGEQEDQTLLCDLDF